MFNKKQINIEEHIGKKTIVLDFIPIEKGIGTRTFLYNIMTIYSKLNRKAKCLILDLGNDMKQEFTKERSINNVKIRFNENFPNLYYVDIEGIIEKTEDQTLLNLLVEKLDVGMVFVKNLKMSENHVFKRLSSVKFLKKTFLMTDLDSENTLSLYKCLIHNNIKNNGTIILNTMENDFFKHKKLENLLSIKNYTKILCKSNNYKIIEYNKMKRQDLFKDIESVNETDIYLEYEDNLNMLLGKPIKGFGKRWVKQVN